jgi:HEAT repeats
MRWSPSTLSILLVGLLALVGLVLAAGDDTSAIDEQILKDAKLGTDGPALLDVFRKRTVSEGDLVKIKAQIKQLGDDSFTVREKASADLAAWGVVAIPLLREALKNPDIEVVHRAEECLRVINEANSDLVAAAAARLLAVRKPAGTVEVLLGYLPFADNEDVAEAIRGALAANAIRDGKLDPLLQEALADKSPVKRGAAAWAVCRAGGEENRAAVRKLLEDPNATVRLRAGLALVSVKEKDAVPVLIDLLGELPPAQAWTVEDLLYRMAADKAPAVSPGTDEASRKKYKEVWAAWWQENGAGVDLAKLDEVPATLGYTLMVLLDQGKVLEVDASKKIRWELANLEFPLDVQYLPGDRILAAENNANRVTERNLKGEILWHHDIPMPIAAQRQLNGNTFIATRNALVEVNRDGKEVFHYQRPNGEQFMRGLKLRNGEVACVTEGHRFVKLDAAGKEVQGFPVDIQTFGGRIEVLPNGRVLVPLYSSNKVVEMEGEGKVVWEAAVPFGTPIAATRLPNGNTLVTSMNQAPAVEIDRAGKVVWEYKTDTRITRAFRR